MHVLLVEGDYRFDSKCRVYSAGFTVQGRNAGQEVRGEQCRVNSAGFTVQGRNAGQEVRG
eukprot:259694-Chlamydomonas_euryale.AAC.7